MPRAVMIARHKRREGSHVMQNLRNAQLSGEALHTRLMRSTTTRSNPEARRLHPAPWMQQKSLPSSCLARLFGNHIHRPCSAASGSCCNTAGTGVCNSSASTTLCDSVRPGPAPLTHSHPIRPVELASGKSPPAVSQGTRCECCRCRQHAEKSQARGHPRREGGCTGQTAAFMARTTCVQSTPERRQARRRR